MDANTYQQKAARTLIEKPGFILTTEEMDAVGEAMVVSHEAAYDMEWIKKIVFHRHRPFDPNEHEQVVNTPSEYTSHFLNPLLDESSIMYVWNLVGLIGELSELIPLVYGSAIKGSTPDTDAIMDELGDVLWYLAAIATRYKIDLNDVMTRNLTKLIKRYPKGFEFEQSKHREIEAQL